MSIGDGNVYYVGHRAWRPCRKVRTKFARFALSFRPLISLILSADIWPVGLIQMAASVPGIVEKGHSVTLN